MSPEIIVLPAEASDRAAFDWGHLTWFANRALGNSDELTVGRCVLKPGCKNPRHYHPNCTEILVVIQGRIRHTSAGGTETEMGEGSTVSVPANVWHCATNVGEGEAVLFIAFSSADRQTVGE